MSQFHPIAALTLVTFGDQTAVFPQFFKIGRNMDTGEGVFSLADEFCKTYRVSFTKPPTCKQASLHLCQKFL
jgi:hypothetical protein